MATDGPSWADQWGEGGIGAMPDENTKSKKDVEKANNSAGFGKAKAAAMAGAQKMKRSTSTSIKWVKNMCQKKTSSK